MLAVLLWCLQLPVLAIVLCPVVVLYLLGPYVSSGISLWRLIEHDYGNAGDGDANLKPALTVLYSLGVAQGVLFGYKTMYDLVTTTRLAEKVAGELSLDADLVSGYLDETVQGCTKDPSFARGRNLVTYALDLLMAGSKPSSRNRFLSGVQILGPIMQSDYWCKVPRRVLMKQQLTASASFGHVVQGLLETLGPRSPYSAGIREHAARIVQHVADSIRLEQFPRGVQCVSSGLLLTFEEFSWRPQGYERHRCVPGEYERDWLLKKDERSYMILARSNRREEDPPPVASPADAVEAYARLVNQGQLILGVLAADGDNFGVVSSAKGLASKLWAVLVSDKLHDGDLHGEWRRMAAQSLQLMRKLVAAADEGALARLQREMSGNGRATLSSLRSVLGCPVCPVSPKRQAVELLLGLSPSVETPDGGSGGVMLMGILLHIFLLPGNISDAQVGDRCRTLAAEKLQAMVPSPSAGGATGTLEAARLALGSLTGAVAGAEDDDACRISAAGVLKDLCDGYTKDDEYLKELKQAMTDVMPKVLQVVVGCASTRLGTHAVTGTKEVRFLATGSDLEQGDVGQEHTSQQQKKSKLQEAFILLCYSMRVRWIGKDQDLTRQFDYITANMCTENGMPVETFTSLVVRKRFLEN